MNLNHCRSIAGPLLLPLLLVASTAGAQFVDQEQPVMDYTSVGDFVLGGFYNQELAQVFTAGRTGLLAGAEFGLECVNVAEATAGTVTLDVRTVEGGVPGSTLLTAATFDAAGFPGYWPNDYPPYFRRLELSAPVPVTAGIQYALTLRFTSANGTSCGVAAGPEGDPYPGGDGSYRENGPWGWVPLGPRVDLPFRTLMEEESRTSIFHKDQQWICVDRSALPAHLGHGDTRWAPGCGR